MASERGEHWSATFQRLRAETFVLAVTFYCFTHLPMKLERLPILGIEFAPSLPLGSFTLPLLVTSVYFASAWYLRFRIERDEIERFVTEDNRFIEGVKTLRREVSELAVDYNGPVVGEVASLAAMVQEQSTQLQATINAIIASNPDIGADSMGDFQHIMAKTIDQHREMAGRLVEQLDEMRVRLRDDLDKIEQQSKLATEVLPGALMNFEAASQDFIRRTTSWRSTFVWDRKGLGFWIPFLASMVMIVWSAPQAALDARPIVARALACFSAPAPECILRPPLKVEPSSPV